MPHLSAADAQLSMVCSARPPVHGYGGLSRPWQIPCPRASVSAAGRHLPGQPPDLRSHQRGRRSLFPPGAEGRAGNRSQTPQTPQTGRNKNGIRVLLHITLGFLNHPPSGWFSDIQEGRLSMMRACLLTNGFVSASNTF